MSDAAIWISFVLAGIVTFYLRYSFIGHYSQMRVPAWFHQALRFVPAAVLSALVWKAIVFYGGSYQLSWTNERLIAGLLAMVVAWRSKNVLLTTLLGMVILWVLQALGL